MEAGTFTRISELDDFPATIEALGTPDGLDGALSDLSSTFCRLLVEHEDAMPIGLVHTVTPIAAMRTLLARVPAISTDAVYARLWQVNAALVAGFTFAPPRRPPATGVDRAPSPTELAARAADHPDPHVVKFTEACLREHTLQPDPVYLIAANHLIARLPGR